MAKDFFRTRTEIAAHFGVTRMTLYRWEKLVPLTHYKGAHVWKSLAEIKQWRDKVWKEDRKQISS